MSKGLADESTRQVPTAFASLLAAKTSTLESLQIVISRVLQLSDNNCLNGSGKKLAASSFPQALRSIVTHFSRL